LKLHYDTGITVTGPLGPFVDGEAFVSNIEMGFQVANSGNWRKTIDASLDELNQDIGARLAEYRVATLD
jgi:hypothetical protein